MTTVDSEQPLRSSRERWLTAIAVLACAVMEVLDTTVVNVSLPHVAGSLSASVEEATWVLTSYLVANAIILPITGWLANYFGRKRLLMTLVTGFTVSSILCGLAPSLPMLIFFRVMQGITGGGLQPLSQAVLLEEFPGKERGPAMALWGMGIIAAPVLGPVLGGWVTDTYSWRWVFYVNVPVGIFSLIMIYIHLKDPHYIRRGSMRVDAWGLGMLAVGMGSLQILLDKGQEEDWFESHLIAWLAVFALVFLTLFVIRELRARQPLVRLRLLKYRSFATGVCLMFVLGFVLYGSVVMLPLFMQRLLDWTALTAGFWTSPRGLGTAFCMPVVGILLRKGWDARGMLIFGFATAGLAFFGFARMNLQSGTWDIFLPQILQGAGMAFIFVPLTLLTMDPIPKEDMGYATSLFSVTRNIGGSAGISFVTTWIARRAQFHQSVLTAHTTIYDLDFREAMRQTTALFLHHGQDATSAAHQGLGLIYGAVVRQAMLLSFLDVFWLLGWAFLGCTVLVLLLRRPRHAVEEAQSVPEAAPEAARPGLQKKAA